MSGVVGYDENEGDANCYDGVFIASNYGKLVSILLLKTDWY